MEEGFYDAVMECANDTEDDEGTVHIFAVIGADEKVNAVCAIMEDMIKINFRNVLSGRDLQKSTKELDRTGNCFSRCVQEFFCEQPLRFPREIGHCYGEMTIRGIFCDGLPEQQEGSIAEEMLELWLERERPMLCGRQLMIRSFFMRDFVGRKVAAALPETESGGWRLVFEGGHQLLLHENAAYQKETLHPNDLGMFFPSNIQSILLNPVYAYGQWLQPSDLCEEWHKVFLYLCAVSGQQWDPSGFAKVYETFLEFLKENICIAEETPTIIKKDEYWQCLLRYIDDFRNFLKGDDEAVISKDLHQTLNSRYIYLPYLWPLVTIKTQTKDFSASTMRTLVDKALRETNSNRKGVLWEDAAAYMLGSIYGWKISGRRVRAGAQEIDLSLVNCSLDDRLWQLGAYILVECKNWENRVDIQQIRNIAHISNLKGNKTAILFAANGITENAKEEIYRLTTENFYLICITADEMKMLPSAEDCKELILHKWFCLHDNMHAPL